jgi:hypothetical protein
MKPSKVRFAQFQKFLRQMGFLEIRDQLGWRFEEPSSNTIFLFRPYRLTDRVYEHDLFKVRCQLEARGMMTEEAFNESLTKLPA